MLSQLSATQIHPTDVRLKWNESAFVLRVLDGSFDWGTLNLDTDTNDPMLTDSHELTCFSLSFSLSVYLSLSPVLQSGSTKLLSGHPPSEPAGRIRFCGKAACRWLSPGPLPAPRWLLAGPVCRGVCSSSVVRARRSRPCRVSVRPGRLCPHWASGRLTAH